MSKNHLLIDGDILIYKIATASEEATHWGDGVWTLHADAKTCIGNIENVLKTLQHNLDAETFTIALTDEKNFRKDVLPSYKSNRLGRRKPLTLPALREYLLEKYKAVIYKGLEADDVLGILATTPNKSKQVIVSIDKDFRQIPSFISSNGQDIINISPEQADYWFMVQTLAGDNVDGYTGLPTCGVKTALKILGDNIKLPIAELWEKVVTAYKKKGFSEKEVLQQARVAKILRHGEYNEKTGEVKLWKM